MYPSETFDFEHNGKQFRAYIEQDDDMTPPWDREDGHVPVSDWEYRNKAPSEVIINKDRRAFRFVCIRDAIDKATREGWGLNDADMQALAENIQRTPTKREIISEAVRLDVENMRAWCANEWSYIGVCVCLLDGDGHPIGNKHASALWGIESNADDYIREVAHDLAHYALSEAKRLHDRIGAVIQGA